jgi:hypothetical protein
MATVDELCKKLSSRLTHPQDVIDVYNLIILARAEGVEQALRELASCEDPHGALSEMIEVKEQAEMAAHAADVIGMVIAKYEREHLLAPKEEE